MASLPVASDLMALVLLKTPGRDGRRHCPRLDPAFRHPDGLRRPARGLLCHPRRTTSARCRAASSVSRSTRTATRRCAWRCRPASSTSAARRLTPTSAPRRSCSPTWPACTPSHGPQGLRTIAQRIHRSGCDPCRRRCKRGRLLPCTTKPFFDTAADRASAPARFRLPRAHSRPASTCAR